VKPSAAAFSSLMSSSAAAPSVSGLEFPAVTVPPPPPLPFALPFAFQLPWV
jgi:hypothetical protein